MNTGWQSHIRSIRIPLGFFVLLLMAGPVMAQTTDATCVADSLYLVSPDNVDTRLNVVGRQGMEISWENLDPSQATCAGLIIPDTLMVDVSYEGYFLDTVDRVFRFVSADSGVVGGTPMMDDPLALGGQRPRSLRVNWASLGPSTNGSYEGSFNLANNGGVLELAGGNGGDWGTINQNLPTTWYQMNVTAFAEGLDGLLFAGLSGGSVPDSDSKGLYRNSGDGWENLGAEFFPSTRTISFIEISPLDNNFIAVGTARDGLWISHDGGTTFVQWTYELDPENEDQPASYNVSALLWTNDKLLVALPNYGVFRSEDDGLSFTAIDFTVPQDLDAVTEVLVTPVIRDFVVDPSDSDHFIAGLVFHGAWESFDGGVTWTDLYGDLNIPVEDEPGAWIFSALEVLVDADNPQIILMGIDQRGIFRTVDGGNTWVLVAESAQPGNAAALTKFSFAQRSSVPGEVFVFEDNWGLIFSTDSGATWNAYPSQPTINRGYNLVASRNGQDYLLGTTYGGVYVAGSDLNLSETYTSGTTPDLRTREIGLDFQISSEVLDYYDTFSIVCQTFQGWAVWRSLSHEPDNMALVGLYDKVNPEACIEGYCGDVSYELLPNCFAAKKAACFQIVETPDAPDSVRFFDQEVYEGFSYYYSVTSFDYGNTALTTPENNTNVMIFSPRWDDDSNSPYPGSGNRTLYEVNSVATPSGAGEPIYVFPNPLREGVGVPGSEGETVVFTNLPADSRVRVFTTAGDDVINLGPDTQVGNNIRWNTRNRGSERVTAGVYLYKVEMPQREDFWGKLVVIR